jgi:uncharacterized protein (TIGR03437 family)
MRSKRAFTLLFFPISLLAQADRIIGPIDDTVRAALQGTVHSQVHIGQDLGRASGSFQLGYITLVMKPSAAQQSELEQLLEDQQDRSSASYHRWLTPEQFGDRFGLSRSDISKLTAWIEGQGFRVETVARARNWIAFSGPAEAAERAFRTEIHHFGARGERHFANVSEFSIPEALAGVVSSIRGLNDFSRQPSRVVPEYITASGANQLAPDDWATIYNVKPLYDRGIDGTGQRVAIVGRSDFSQAWMDTFRQTFGLPPSQIEMHLIGPDPGSTNAAGEAALDVEWSGAIARNATIVYVYSNNFDDAVQGAIDQNLAPVLSESFGTCELQGSKGNRSMAQQANAQGITWVASSGDSGGAGCDPHGFFGTTGNTASATMGLAVNIPASYPEVTAIGGTQFNEGNGQYWNGANNPIGGSVISYIPEVVWNETGAGGLLASGGGASIYFSKPAWQHAAGVPDDGARDVPDISFSASGNHDPYVVVNANGQRATAGTSAGAPSFAGVLALLNQYVVSEGIQNNPGLGNINPELYRLAGRNVFHDVLQGNNLVPCATGSPSCSTGSLGFTAGPGYDQATGLGSIDVYNLFTEWRSQSLTQGATTTTVVANPKNISFGGTVQVTATVSAADSGTSVPTGIVTFTSGATSLGSVTLVNSGGAAAATLTITGPLLAVGNATVIATYSGDSNFSGSTGSTSVNVAPPASPGSAVIVGITPNPAHEGQSVRVTLTEVAGIGTTITGWSINGVDDFSRFPADFGSVTLPAYGTLAASFITAVPAIVPSNRVYTFTGTDADGRQWSKQYTLVLEGASSPGVLFSAVAPTVHQNRAADPSCQWSEQLIIEERNGLEVQLTRLLANGVDWTNRIQPLFGTSHLGPLGNLQASVCWPAGTSPQAVNFEIRGTDQAGSLVDATVSVTLAGPAPGAAALSVSNKIVALSAANPSTPATADLSVNLTDNTQAWTVSVFASGGTARWLTLTPLSGAGSQTVSIAASGAGLGNGVQYAWLVFTAENANPQFIEVPVVFTLGAAPAVTIAGLTNAASFQPVFAPGMIMSVFGNQLAPSVEFAAGIPLPLTLAGVSATVNGIPAPLYYISPGLLNIQIPYETSAGPAVLGVNNNGQVASFVFNVTASAPGIFTGAHSALVPFATAKSGDTLPLYLTGAGDVSPAVATGASPFFATPVNLLPAPRLPITLAIGGIDAQIAFAGIPPGVAGITQVNFVVPRSTPPGLQPVVISVGGLHSATAFLTVAP